jgi:hypothetical protein
MAGIQGTLRKVKVKLSRAKWGQLINHVTCERPVVQGEMLEFFADGGLKSGVVLNKSNITCVGVYFEFFFYKCVWLWSVWNKGVILYVTDESVVPEWIVKLDEMAVLCGDLSCYNVSWLGDSSF